MWEKVKLGAVFSVIRNGASIKQTEGATGIPITRIETISSGILDQTKLGYADINNNKFESYYLSDGDILMSHINSLKHLGKTALVNELGQSVIHGMNLLLLRTNERCFSKYVKYFFETKIFYGQILSIANQSVNQSSFTVNKLKDLEIPLPPLSIQEKIADILDKADELRRKDKDLQSKYDELSQAIFIDMFGDPVRNEKGWEVKKLEKYIDSIVDVGSNGANDWVSKNIQMKDTEDYAIMIRTTNLTKNDFINNLKYVSRDTYELFNKTKVYGGEMIMNKIGSAGDFWLMPYLNRPVSLGLNQLMIKISNINMTFLLKQMSINSFKKYIKSKTQGAITKSITKGAVKDLEIILPPIALQEEFAKKIDIINKLKAQANTAKSEELFQVLLQKAFKGDVVS